MLALVLLLTQTSEVEPRKASWAELRREVFDPAWILPNAGADPTRALVRQA